MIKCLSVVILFFLMGCASTEAIYKNYDRLVHMDDGVDAQEAKIMAQRKLINTVEKDSYRITSPDIKKTPQALQYPDFWFVVFGHNWLSPISTDPLAKTYTELRETQYLVVIEKKTGKVLFFGEWHPKRQNDFQWVFEGPQAYRKKSPLSLPPGEQSQTLF